MSRHEGVTKPPTKMPHNLLTGQLELSKTKGFKRAGEWSKQFSERPPRTAHQPFIKGKGAR